MIGGGIFFRLIGLGDGQIFSIKCTVFVDDEFERYVRVNLMILVVGDSVEEHCRLSDASERNRQIDVKRCC